VKFITSFLFGFLLFTFCNGQNATNGGTIGHNQNILAGEQPDTLVNITDGSGGDTSLAIEYLWKSTTDAILVDHPTSAAPGINNKPYYVPPPLTQTTYFIRNAVREGFSFDNHIADSNILIITVDPSTSTQAIKLIVSPPFPNPTSDFIQISFNNNTSQNWKVDIFDIGGSLKKSLRFNSMGNHQTIDLQELQSGNYLVQITNLETHETESHKIFKN